MLDDDTKAAVRDAIDRVFTGRERVPGDLPYPPAVESYMLATVWPHDTLADRQRRCYSKAGREVSRATRQVYLAGWFAGRAGDAQIARQVREAFGIFTDAHARTAEHPYIGLAVCIICDQPPDHEVHGDGHE